MRRAVVAAVLGAVLVSGCSNAVGQEAAAVALEFVRAEPGRACELLAPATAAAVLKRSGDCAQGLAATPRVTEPRVIAAEVAGESAQVRLKGDVVFLARFPGGWLVTAAGCSRHDADPAVPYECEVEP